MKSRNALKKFVLAAGRGILAGLVLGGMFAAGFIVRGMTDEQSATVVQAQDSSQFSLLQQVDLLVKDNFYAELPNGSTLEYAAIRGYLGALNDPYSFFNDPPVAQSESDALAGVFGGIGVTVKRNVQGLVELYPYPDSPALEAGVKDGDILVAINGVPIQLTDRIDVIQQQLRGEVKDENGAEITVRSPDSEEERTYTIPFAEIFVPSMFWRILPGEPILGYIHITSFTARTPDELETAYAELKTQGMVGLVLDLRDNFGGLLRESVDVADVFLDSGIIFVEKSRKNGETINEATPGGYATEIPLVIVTNFNTASAAEIVAAAVQQNGRGTLVGQQTRGKGSVQLIFRLPDESSFRITGSVWLTPNYTPLDGTGLIPDIPMIPDENNRDVELDEAVRQLRQMVVEN